MAAGWTIIVPESGTNLVFNPSAEATGNFTNSGASTVTQDSTYARFGNQCYKIVPTGTNQGISLTTTSLQNLACFVSCYAQYPIGPIQGSIDNGATWVTLTLINNSSGLHRYGGYCTNSAVAISAVLIRDNTNETFYVDGVQVEQNSGYATTFIDGDQGPLYRWTGLRAGSTSTRDAQDRSGGRERDLYSVYGINVRQQPGAGMPPIVNNQQPYALQPGSIFQSYKINPRAMTLIMQITGASATLASFHSKRKALIDLIKPDAFRGAQPFILGYTLTGTTKTMYGSFRYDGGLGLGQVDGGANWIEQGGKVPVTVVANDPFWYEDGVDTFSMTLQTSLTTCGDVLARLNGLWQKLGTGMNGTVYAIVVDKQRNRIYFGGAFTTANGVTVNRFTYWNGTTFVAMDSGVNNDVRALALAPNGDVWVGGTFTTVGGAATASKGLAKWSISGSSWSVPTASATLTSIDSLAVDLNGNLYGGGVFSVFGGVANTTDIFKYDGTTFTALGSGMNGQVKAMVIGLDGTTLYVGGSFTTGNAVTLNTVGYWNGTTFVAMGAGFTTSVGVLAISQDGTIYAGGNLGGASNLAKWNGTAWSLIATVTQVVSAMAWDRYLNVLHFGHTDSKLYFWNGYTQVQEDLLINTTSPILRTIATSGGDVYFGWDTSPTILIATQTTGTIQSTASCFPVFYLTATTTAASQTTLIWLENQSTGERLYFNLTINTGETVIISLLPGNKTIVSDWRGLIPSQPLSASDFAAFHLLPGSNTLSAFATGTVTGATLRFHYQYRHYSIDGSAA